MIDKISHSDVDAYKLCTRKSYYGGTLNLESKSLSVSLSRGILMHKVLEAHFKEGEEAAKQVLRDSIVPILTKNPDDTEALTTLAEVKELYDYFLESNLFAGWTVLAVEKKYSLEFFWKGKKLLYPFTVDLLIQSPAGKVYLVDHKTTYAYYLQKQIDLNSQLPKYMAALKMLGVHVDFAAYVQFKYRNKKDKTVDDVIRWTPFEPNELRQKTMLREQLQMAGELYEFHQLPLEKQAMAPRTANNLVCKNCMFADLCISDLNGYDTKLLIKTKYQQREDRYSEFDLGSDS